jgi:hypothetical protein
MTVPSVLSAYFEQKPLLSEQILNQKDDELKFQGSTNF